MNLKQEWDAIDATEDTLDSRKWTLARRLAESEKGTRDLADETGRPQRRVQEWIQVHREQGAHAGARSFAQAIERVKGATPQGERARKDATAARKVIRDPEQRRQVIDSLEPEERAELVRDVARTAPVGGVADREYERELAERVEKAPDFDLSAQAAKFVATASQLEVLLADGAEFKRLDAKGLQRMDRDLERVKDTAEKLREQVAAQSRVRRVA